VIRHEIRLLLAASMRPVLLAKSRSSGAFGQQKNLNSFTADSAM
jgi:hypothetical protein